MRLSGCLRLTHASRPYAHSCKAADQRRRSSTRDREWAPCHAQRAATSHPWQAARRCLPPRSERAPRHPPPQAARPPQVPAVATPAGRRRIGTRALGRSGAVTVRPENTAATPTQGAGLTPPPSPPRRGAAAPCTWL
eukprot:scaffold196_cov371-Prasinococcus_capsulatus_cf.AAC.4